MFQSTKPIYSMSQNYGNFDLVVVLEEGQWVTKVRRAILLVKKRKLHNPYNICQNIKLFLPISEK